MGAMKDIYIKGRGYVDDGDEKGARLYLEALGFPREDIDELLEMWKDDKRINDLKRSYRAKARRALERRGKAVAKLDTETQDRQGDMDH